MTGTFAKGVLWRGSFVKIWSGLLPGDHGSSHWYYDISDIDTKQTPLDVYVRSLYIMSPDMYTVHVYTQPYAYSCRLCQLFERNQPRYILNVCVFVSLLPKVQSPTSP